MVARRNLIGLLASLFGFLGVGRAKTQAVFTPPDEEAFDAGRFPFPLVTVPGKAAFATWTRLREEGGAIPVIIGSNYHASRILDAMEYARETPVILQAAAGVRFPEDWLKQMERDRAETEAYFAEHPEPGYRIMTPEGVRDPTPEEVAAEREAWRRGPEIGEWPSDSVSAEPSSEPTLSLAMNFTATRRAEKVHIALIPTKDWTEVPAFLKFGGFNSCPPTEFQVAALRSLRDRYGAELIGCGCDTIELRVARQPATRQEAVALARELNAYCEDSISQGYGTLSTYAAALMSQSIWTFWWD